MADEPKGGLAALIVAKGKPPGSGPVDAADPLDSGPEGAPDDSSPDAGLEAAADDLIAAVQSGDTKGVVAALRAAFEQLEAPPLEEPDASGPPLMQP